MTFRTLLFVPLLAWVVAAQAQTPEQAFQSANLLFQQGKMAEARDAYAALLAQGYTGGEVLYNLGNASYRAGDIAGAILAYERALRYMPGDEDLRHNLQLMNLMITDRIEPAPRLFVWEWWDGVKGAFSLSGVTWWAYLWYIVVAVAASLFLMSRRYAVRRAALIGGATAAVLLIGALTIFAGKLSDVASTDAAIVMRSLVTVKNSPDARSSDAFILHAGVKVLVLDSVSGWVQVRLADGKVGWIEGNSLERI
jgi:tetratricopeptide (TPR) repeat protein